MRKISSYLYPNRIEIIADLAAFYTENTNVYQRNVKIYNGIDNTIEFDIKNADQKRIDLVQFQQLWLNVMDASGNELPNSPYAVTPTALKGIATAVIPEADLVNLSDQYLKYSLTGLKDSADVLFYADTRFGAAGTIELIGNALPTIRDEKVYDSFTAEIDLKGQPTHHSSAIPATFYEAVPTEEMSIDVSIKGLTGSVWIEATKDDTISVESFKKGDIVKTFPSAEDFTGIWSNTVAVNDYRYFRVSYTTPTANGVGSSFSVSKENNTYTVSIRAGGTGYAVGSQIKVLGSVLGGTDIINDLIITVTSVDAASTGYISSYAVSSITAVTSSGTASNGTATYIVTGTNITGTVDKVTVS